MCLQLIASVKKRGKDLLVQWRQMHNQSGAMCDVQTASYLEFAFSKAAWFPSFTTAYQGHKSAWPIQAACNEEDDMPPLFGIHIEEAAIAIHDCKH
jgi:hypothetical protein